MSVFLDSYFPHLSLSYSVETQQPIGLLSEKSCACSELESEENAADKMLQFDKGKILKIQNLSNISPSKESNLPEEKNTVSLLLEDPDIFQKIYQSFNHHRVFGTVPIINSLSEEPEYVNRLQYSRIIKRKNKKKGTKAEPNNEKPEESNLDEKKNYRYESRHVHAITRDRDSNGRFTSRTSANITTINFKAIEKSSNRKGRNVKKKGPTTKWSPHTHAINSSHQLDNKCFHNFELTSEIFIGDNETPRIDSELNCNIDNEAYELDLFGNNDNIFSYELALPDACAVKQSGDFHWRILDQKFDTDH